MPRSFRAPISSATFLAFLAIFAPLAGADESLPAPVVPRFRQTQAQPPLVFEPNSGNGADRLPWLSRAKGYALYLGSAETVAVLGGESGKTASVVRMRLKGAKPGQSAQALDATGGVSNYLIGQDRSRWKTNVPHFKRVRFDAVYPGIDLVYYGNPNQLEYDFLVQPGADAKRIVLEFEGIKRLRLDEQGDLHLVTPDGKELIQKKPQAKQAAAVNAWYRKINDRAVAIEVGEYDRSQPLLIDPVMAYSTFLGASGAEDVRAIRVDPTGNLFVAGSACVGFPATPGAYKTTTNTCTGYLAKINPSGTSIVYATYLGGSLSDSIDGLALDAFGNSYVTGQTQSSDFPLTGGAFQSTNNRPPGSFIVAFVTKINPTGNALVYSTLLAGTNGQDSGYAIAVDPQGNAIVGGRAGSSNFPTVNAFQPTKTGLQDAFIAKLNPSGSALVFSSFLGSAAQNESITSVALDSQSNIWLAGTNADGTFPVFPAAAPTADPCCSGFVAKLTPSGTRILAKPTSLTGNNSITAIAADASSGAVVVGKTLGPITTTLDALQPAPAGPADGFVMRINSAGDIVYSSYFGGNGSDTANALALDGSGNIYVTGYTYSTNFPLVSPVSQVPVGVRLFRSTDQGSTWSQTGLTLPDLALGDGGMYGFAVRASNPAVLYAALQGVLYRSTNSGANWSQLNCGPENASITLHPANSNIAYWGQHQTADDFQTCGLSPVTRGSNVTFHPANASIAYSWDDFSGVYKSIDSGQTWAPAVTGLNSFPATTQAFAVHPQNPSLLYAIQADGGPPFLHRIFKSIDAGAHWTFVSAPFSSTSNLRLDSLNQNILYLTDGNGVVQKSIDGGVSFSAKPLVAAHAPVAAFLAIHPANPQLLFAGTTPYSPFSPNPGGPAIPAGIYRSTNGGDSWTLDNNTLAHHFAQRIAFDPTNPSVMYAGGWATYYPYVTVLSPDAKRVLFSTYLGGSYFSSGTAIAAGPSSVYVGGTTSSGDFPVTGGAAQPVFGGSQDGFAARLVTGASVTGVTPNSGNGSTQSFAFAFADSAGASAIRVVKAIVGDPNTPSQSCSITVDTVAGTASLAGAIGNPQALGAAGTLQNNQCSLNLAGSSKSPAGNALTVTLALTFKPAFAGARIVYAYAEEAGVLSTITQRAGTWTVPGTPVCGTVSLTSGTRVYGAGGGPGSATIAMTTACAWTATTDSSWITLNPDASGAGNKTFTYSVGANLGQTRLGTITAAGQSFKILQSQSGTSAIFNDVPFGAAYFDYISLMWTNGITAGCSANPPLYCPDTPVTRAQMSVFIVAALNKAMGTTLIYSPTPYFDDMPSNSGYFPFVQRIKDLGITAGCSTSPPLFCPDSSITQGQMAVFMIVGWMLENGLSDFTYTATPYFTDVPANHPFFKFIQKMRDLGFWTGCTATTYCDSSPVTRAQMAPMIMRSLMGAP